MPLSSLDIMAITQELKLIEGGRIQDIFQPTPYSLRIDVYKECRHTIIANINGYIYFSINPPTNPAQPSNFISILRKHLMNKKVDKIEQIGFERIVQIKIWEYALVIELVKNGNILLNKGERILQVMKPTEWKDRILKPNFEYILPPMTYDPSDYLQLSEALKSDKKLIYILARGVGGKWGEEICERAGVDKNARAKDTDSILIYDKLLELIDEVKSRPDPNLGSDFRPIDFYGRQDEQKKYFQTFSEAVENYLNREKVNSISESEKSEQSRTERMEEERALALKDMEDRAEKCRKIGDLLYSDYNYFEEVISDIREKREVNELIDMDYPMALIRSRDAEIELDITQSIQTNATRYYEKGKQLKKKYERSQAFKGRGTGRSRDNKGENKEKEITERKFWFEKYKWFISSDGNLIVAGRDAISNEKIVKRHMKPDDIYVHADVHGAPSVLIKDDGKGIDDRTKKEACEFAVSHSRAWKNDIIASAYWVKPDQVSKRPPAGEFLAKGAFMIYGKKNYEHKIVPKLAIGEVEIDGVKKLMCAPESTIKSRTDKFSIITPGDKSKVNVSKELARIFNRKMDAIVPILPGDNIDINEK